MVHVEVIQLVAGFLLLVGGAAGLVEGGSALAKRVGISPLWIGLTVVALGTSAPELVVTALASYEGLSGVALGNVVGSNILNILVVLGITALAMPVVVGRVTVRRDIAIVFGVSLLVYALALDGTLHWAEGAILLAGVGPYVVHVYREEKRGWVPTDEPPKGMDETPLPVQIGAVVLGIAALVIGGRLMVDGGTGVAQLLGVSDRVIGLTIIAMGTSLPELATSLVAVFRKKVDLALGNLMGSNLLNLLLVLGVAATIRPLEVEGLMLWLDLPLMVLVTLLLWRFAASKGRIGRLEGGLLVGVYVAYVGVLLANVVT